MQEFDEKPVSPCRVLVPVMDDEKPIPLKDDVKPTPLKGGAKPANLMENVVSSFPELPDIFAKIFVGGNSSEPTKTIPAASKAKKITKQVHMKKGKKQATKAKKKNGAGAKPAKDVEVISSGDECDLDILASAMAFMPAVAVAKKGASKPKAPATPKAKAKAKDTKPAMPKKSVSKKKDANNSGPVSEGQKQVKPANRWLDASRYGKCKVEHYKEKSYVRNFDAGGKFRSIISSCCSKHHMVIEKMIPYIEQG